VPVRLIVAVPLVEELLVMVNLPEAAPAVVGSNCTVSVAAWLGFSVSGKVAPDIVNPVPVRVAALMVTDAVPEEVRVRDCVAGTFIPTLPNATLVELMLSVGVPVFNCRAKVFETPPALAVKVAAWAEVTDETVAVNAALVALAATVTVVGTLTAALPLDRLRLSPPLGAAALNVTVQASVPDPVMDVLPQESALNAAEEDVPVPLRAMVAVPLVEELLVMVNLPEAAPAVVGSNCAFSVTAWLGGNVTGKVAPDIVNPVPVRVAALMVTDAVPEEVRVRVCVVGVLSATLPNATLLALMLNVGVAAFNCRAKVLEMPPAVAVNVAAWAVVTDETVAVNAALVALAATVTVAGTVTAALLLERLTLSPPLGAAALNVTVQASVPDPVMDALPQERALNAVEEDVPVPLNPIVAVGLVAELLTMVNLPVAAPAVVGLNFTVTVAAWLGFNVSGKVAPDIVKPVPVSVAALTMTGSQLVEVRVRDCAVDALTAALPNARLVALMLSAWASPFNVRAKLLETPPALAASVATCVVALHDAVAVNAALVAPAGTVTVAGSTTDELLLTRPTLSPPLGATALRLTVQASCAHPSSDALAQESPLNAGVALADTARGKQKQNIKRALICQWLSRHIPAYLRAECRIRCELSLGETVVVVASS